MSHITGRRLDIDDGSSLVLFRSASILPTHTENENVKIVNNNYIQNLKQQDLKANIEKLKFHRNDVKLDATKNIKQSGVKNKNVSNSKVLSDAKKNQLPTRPVDFLRRNTTQVNPAETAEVRKKKALEWLHNEKKEMEAKTQAKRAYLDTAKDMEQRRRQAVLNDAHRRRQVQMEVLHVEQYGPNEQFDQHGNKTTNGDDRLNEPMNDIEHQMFTNTRASTESALVIDRLAEHMALSKPVASRPIVPRLSRNYVNRRSLVFKEGEMHDTQHNEDYAPTTRLVLINQPPEKTASAAAGGEEQEEDYGLDVYEDDFDTIPPGPSTTTQKDGTAKREEEEESRQALKQPAYDLITARTLELAHQRREAGKLFAKQQHARIVIKEREERLKQEQEAESRRNALERLKSRVSNINHHNENTVQLKTQAELLRDRTSASTRVYQYSSDGRDFHTKFADDDHENSFGPGDFAITRSHLLEEEDVPLRDFLAPRHQGDTRVESRGGQRSVSTGSRSRQTARGTASSSGVETQPAAKKKAIVSTVVAPFRFNSWAPTENSTARAKAYQNSIGNVAPVSHDPTRRKSAAPSKPLAPSHLSGTKQLYPAGKKEKKKKTKTAPKRVKRSSRSLIDDALEAEVLELLNRSDHSGPQRGSLPYNADPLDRTVNMMSITPSRGAGHHQHNGRDEGLSSVQKLFSRHPSLSLPQQQPLDVSRMANRNLGEVRKVIGEVDRMCELLNAQTAMLERKLTARESMESLDLGAMRSALAAKLSTKVTSTFNDYSLNNQPSGEHKHDTPSPSLSDQSEEEDEDDNNDNEETEEEVYISQDEEEEEDEGPLNISMSPSAAMIASAGSDRYRQFHHSDEESDEDQSQQDDEESSDQGDRVLMGDHSDNEDQEEYHDRLASSNYGARDASVRLSRDQSLSADPVLRHQLGLAADRRQLMEKFGRLAEDAAREEQHSQNDRFSSYTTKVASARHLETKSNSAFSVPSRGDLPSLRNVGQLATLLRTNYIKLTGGEREEDVDSDSGEESEEEDVDPENDFRAVSIVARAIAQQRAAQMAESEAQLRATNEPVGHDLDDDQAMGNAFKSVSRSSMQSDEPERRSVELADPNDATDSPLAFWDSMLTRPLKHNLNTSTGSFSDTQLQDLRSSDGSLHQEAVGENHQQDRLHATTLPSIPADEQRAPVQVKRSGAEMRREMLEELRRQDEYFHYTMELSEIEKNNALQNARDLSHAAKSRSEAELNQLRLQQEVELQKVAYENALAISMANAHLVAEQNTMTQKQELLQLHSQLNLQQIQSEYSLLLAQADTVSENLEHNQKLVWMEQLLREEKDRFLLAERERLLGEERERLVAVSKEQERLMAIEREQLVATVQRQQQQHSLELTKRELEARLAHVQLQQDAISASVSKPITSSREVLMAGRQLEEADSFDEYSADFEASAVSRSRLDLSVPSIRGSAPQGRHGIPIPLKVPVKAKAAVDESISTEAEYSSRFSPPVSDDEASIEEEDEISDEDHVNMRDKSVSEDEDSDEISEEVSASAGLDARRQSVHQPHEESSIEDEEVPEADDDEEQYSEDSIEEESEELAKTKSPLRNKLHAKYVAEISSDEDNEEASVEEDHEMSRHHEDDSEEVLSEEEDAVSEETPSSVADSSEHSEISEEEEQREEQDSVSIAEQSAEYSEDKYDEYSDTFESKMSVASSARSSIVKPIQGGRPPLTVGGGGGIKKLPSGTASKGRTSAEDLTYMKTSLLEASASMSSSGGSGAVDDAQLNAVLSQYQAQMEMRLLAHDETHAVRVAFLAKKHAKRLAALELLSSDPDVTARQLKEERKAVDALLQEETAKLHREKWALNAKAYKEDRRFRELKRDMRAFRANLNDEIAAAEMKAHILGRTSSGQQKQREEEESVNSLSESEQSTPFRQSEVKSGKSAKTVTAVSRSESLPPSGLSKTQANLLTSSTADYSYSYMQDDFETEEQEQSARGVKYNNHMLREVKEEEDPVSEVEEEEVHDGRDNDSQEVEDEVPEEQSNQSSRRSVATASSYSISDERQEEEESSRHYDDFEISTAEVEEQDVTVDYSDSFPEDSDRWHHQSQSQSHNVVGISSTVQSAQKLQQQRFDASQSRGDLSVAYGDDFEEDEQQEEETIKSQSQSQPAEAHQTEAHLKDDEEVEDEDEVSEDIEEDKEGDSDEEGEESASVSQHHLQQVQQQETEVSYEESQQYQSDVFDATSSPLKAPHEEVSSSYLQDDDAFESAEVSRIVAGPADNLMPSDSVHSVNEESEDEDEIEEEQEEHSDSQESDASLDAVQRMSPSPTGVSRSASPFVESPTKFIKSPTEKNEDDDQDEDDASYEEEFEDDDDDENLNEKSKVESPTAAPVIPLSAHETLSQSEDEEDEIEEEVAEELSTGGDSSDEEQHLTVTKEKDREGNRQDAMSASLSVDQPAWTIDSMKRPSALPAVAAVVIDTTVNSVASPNRSVASVAAEEDEEPSYDDEFDDDDEEEAVQSQTQSVNQISPSLQIYTGDGDANEQENDQNDDTASIEEEEVEEDIEELDDNDEEEQENQEILSPLERSPQHPAHVDPFAGDLADAADVSRETLKEPESDATRSRLSTHDSGDDSVSSSALEESKEFELDLKDRKTLNVSELLDHSHSAQHGGIATLKLGDSSGGTASEKMYFDKDTQRWVGGDDVSLDGFDESVDEFGVMSPVRKKSLSVSLSHSSSQSPTVSNRKNFRDEQPFLRPEGSRDNSLKLDPDNIANSYSGSSDEGDVPIVNLPNSSVVKSPVSPVLTTVSEPIVEVKESITEEKALEMDDDEESIPEEDNDSDEYDDNEFDDENEEEKEEEELTREGGGGGGVEDSFLSAVSEEEDHVSPLLPAVTSPLLEETTGSSGSGVIGLQKSTATVQSSDSEKTVMWNNSHGPQDSKESAAVIVTTDVLPSGAEDDGEDEEQYSENSIQEEENEDEKEVEESVIETDLSVSADAHKLVEVSAVEQQQEEEESTLDLSLEAMLDDIDSAFDPQPVLVAALEVSSDSTAEGSLGDLSCDFLESNALVVVEDEVEVKEKETTVPVVDIEKQREQQRLAENERRADEITELLMERLMKSALSVDIGDMCRLLDRSPSPIDSTPSNALEDSSDSMDENTKLFVANKAAQFLSRREVPAVQLTSGPSTPPSPPKQTTPNSFSLSSLKSMPSLELTKPRFGRSHGDHFGHSGSDSDEDSGQGFDDALSSALGADVVSPLKAHPDLSANIPKELIDQAHNRVESIESQSSAEVSIEIQVQDVLHHTEDFLGAVFNDLLASSEVQLVQKLSDPNFEGPFLSGECMQRIAAKIDAGGSTIHKGAILDRINEICDELHSLKHFPRLFMNSCTFGQRLAAQSLPMDPVMVAKHITRHVLDDQRTLVKLLQGEKGLHELLNITAIDVFKEETRAAIQDRSDQIADALMARLLVNTAVEVGKVYNLNKAFGVRS